MSEEFTTLVRNGTWKFVPPNPSQNVVVANGFSKSNENQMGVLSNSRQD